ncbi:MAG: glycosyltransferase family 39 protein, partial [Xenococcaceae cyanobacterium]
FAYWVMTLGIFVLIFDRRRWWLHGLRLSMGVILFLPWFFWGTRQQLSNRSDVFRQLSSDKIITFVDHFQDVASTLATHLLLGDWATNLPTHIVTEVGSIVIVLLIIFTIMLWQKKENRRLGMAIVLGIVPLLLALLVDIFGKKLTVGFGGGRSLIFILPGCLLLIALWMERIGNKWRSIIAGGLLLLYLTIGVTDFSVRSRWMFHELTDIIDRKSTTPTLIAMNSNAWGHVLRLAYYLPANLPVNLLAEKSVDLASRLQQNLQQVANVYERLIWLDLENPVWAKPKTNNEKLKLQTEMRQAIESRYQLITEQYLSGTIDLDNFTARIYQLSTSKSNN